MQRKRKKTPPTVKAENAEMKADAKLDKADESRTEETQTRTES
jgi:hypothetical protein